MTDTRHILFDLIRIALGTREGLEACPTVEQWDEVYDMACKQSVVGICFVGLQHICDLDEDIYFGTTEFQYLKWMASAAKIQQQNECMNSQCARVQKMLATDGVRSCSLKGQGVALVYPKDLRVLRQTGDIDVWVDAPREVTLAWAKAHGSSDEAGELHVECDLFPGTIVELHFKPSVISGRKRDHMLQEWFESRKEECMTNKVGRIITPKSEFNLVYLMQHMFRHYLYEGIGLRHVMDYYMTLCAEKMVVQQETKELVRTFGMEKFAGALMWVIQQVFGGDEALDLPWEPDENRGRRLLEIIMEGGNFGHSTEIYKIEGWDKPWSRVWRFVRRNWYMFRDYPEEILMNILKKIKI